MKGSETNSLCFHGGDMLAYLYSEMPEGDREAFEVHLADCGTCIDDFAELSQSRYPVYEWKRAEFDPLPTPRVVIPFEATVAVSWFDQIRRAFSFRPTLAFGGLGAAMIVAVVGYLILAGTSGNTEVALEVEPSASPARSAVVGPLPSVVPKATDKSEVLEQPPKVVKAKASTPVKPSVRLPKPKQAQQPKRNDEIPVMSSIEDDEDDSLRLADIFEEIGASE